MSMIGQLEILYTKSEADIITRSLFERFAGLKKSDIITHPEYSISENTALALRKALKAILQYTPLQQVIGEAWFYKMKFEINRHVLIPRPETEELVSLVKVSAEKRQTAVTILDIGTGSGCIAITLKKLLPVHNIIALDISEDALDIARRNSTILQTDIRFIATDFLDEEKWHLLPAVDYIVSNPPYIPAGEAPELDKQVAEHEPHIALFVPDNNPLLFYEKIARFGLQHLSKGGEIFTETHENFGEKCSAMFSRYYTNVSMEKDIHGKNRFVTARNGY